MLSNRQQLILGVVAALVLIVATARLVSPAEKIADSSEPFADTSGKLADCRVDALTRIKAERVELKNLEDVSLYCSIRTLDEYKLRDMELRRLALLRQHAESPILLWLVVAITASGVALSALQLLASYRLAITKGTALEGGGEMTLEQSKLAVKSSVTGFLILVTSFAFFLVFVLYVHKVNEIDPDKQTQHAAVGTSRASSQAPIWLSGIGGSGAGPAAGGSPPVAVETGAPKKASTTVSH